VAFTGFPLAALDFYEDLEADNSKSFWTAHKHIYDESVKAPIDALVLELSDEFGPAKIFRPYRDVRFAKDKTPYKTHQGVYFAQSHRYFQISAAGLFTGGGFYELASDQVARYRRAVDDEVTVHGLLDALAKAAKATLQVGGETLVRVPPGFAKDHPHAELLRHKSLTVRRDFGFPDWLQTARARTEIVRSWRAMTPLIDWLDTHVGPSADVLGRGR
jgi:uncharacterized protein (TIGR02453 family)